MTKTKECTLVAFNRTRGLGVLRMDEADLCCVCDFATERRDFQIGNRFRGTFAHTGHELLHRTSDERGCMIKLTAIGITEAEAVALIS